MKPLIYLVARMPQSPARRLVGSLNLDGLRRRCRACATYSRMPVNAAWCFHRKPNRAWLDGCSSEPVPASARGSREAFFIRQNNPL